MEVYDWKKENPKSRYIDSITLEEAKKIAYLALGSPNHFKLLKLETGSPSNNIPHVKIYCKYYEECIHEDLEGVVGIFEDLDTYRDLYHMPHSQKEIIEAYKQMGFE